MNKEQLNKIIRLVKDVEKLDEILEYDSLRLGRYKATPGGWDIEDIVVDKKIVETSLVSYREGLVNKLKELGYEH
jgi:hypothetical protein